MKQGRKKGYDKIWKKGLTSIGEFSKKGVVRKSLSTTLKVAGQPQLNGTFSTCWSE